ncbi:MAG: HipA N-terminal domain-containing protein [Treponemataceae bacterium]|nr:HipA N-terminal domain-containing protein [Treponemataceae bacterium]
MTLDVYFGSAKAGELHSTDDRGIVFSYGRDYLADKDAQGLSASLPIREKEFSQKECLPFFSGLLPEGDSRKKLADYLHISETSTLRLLEALGGECAGLAQHVVRHAHSALCSTARFVRTVPHPHTKLL